MSKSELKRLSVQMSPMQIAEEWHQLRTERDNLLCQVEVMRGALTKVDDWILKLPIPTTGAARQSIEIGKFISATPSSCANTVKHQVLIEAADECSQMALYTGVDCADHLRRMAQQYKPEGGE